MIWFYTICLFIAVVFETTIAPVPITAGILALFALVFAGENPWIFFLTGLMWDLFSMHLLGTGSVLFLIVSWIAQRYKRKFYLGNMLYQIIFISVVVASTSLIYYRTIQPAYLGASVLVSFLLGRLITMTSGSRWEDTGRLGI